MLIRSICSDNFVCACGDVRQPVDRLLKVFKPSPLACGWCASFAAHSSRPEFAGLWRPSNASPLCLHGVPNSAALVGEFSVPPRTRVGEATVARGKGPTLDEQIGQRFCFATSVVLSMATVPCSMFGRSIVPCVTPNRDLACLKKRCLSILSSWYYIKWYA